MCWSGEASTVLATIGLTSTAYFYYKKEPVALCAALGYFSLMEVLQAYTYTVINECDNPANQVATLLGYIHIAFQPFFINAVSLHFIPEAVKNKISAPVYFVCLIATVCLLLRLYPFDWAPACYEVKTRVLLFGKHMDSFYAPICGKRVCSLSGDWHIAWEIPTTASLILYDMYIIAAFVMPILYGSWRMTVYHLMTGPLLAFMTTDNANEWAAVWCLYSIGLVLLLVKSPIRRLLYVRSWFWWRYLNI
ncbi:MAG: DUF5765 domain-containing protein [Methylococcales bacterium]|nr:DUF5765 domain-containing protein [Methylococcales bacterium]